MKPYDLLWKRSDKEESGIFFIYSSPRASISARSFLPAYRPFVKNKLFTPYIMDLGASWSQVFNLDMQIWGQVFNLAVRGKI